MRIAGHRAAAAHILGEEPSGIGDGIVAEDRRQQLVHPVTDRGRPKRPLHGARVHLILAAAGVDAGE
jgi:hypothetical protein